MSLRIEPNWKRANVTSLHSLHEVISTWGGSTHSDIHFISLTNLNLAPKGGGGGEFMPQNTIFWDITF